MKQILPSGIELNIDNPRERLSMGGPYTGDVYFGKELISKDCVLNNFIHKTGTNLLFFVKYHQLNYYYYFTINFYDTESKLNFQFYREFEMIYLKEFISENELHVYVSFNDNFGNNFYFKLDEEDFYQVTS